ncbi:MAG: hypothetical protein OJF50_002481 [Nitrospira sp.]|nr:hypothetical protein [Nitrospira sp.]
MTREDFDKEMNLLLKLGHSRMAVFLSTHDQAQREEIARLREALGLATTLKPDMEININDPVGMMQEVHKYVKSALAKEVTRDNAE